MVFEKMEESRPPLKLKNNDLNNVEKKQSVIEAVNNFAAIIPPEKVRKAVRDILIRADACIARVHVFWKTL